MGEEPAFHRVSVQGLEWNAGQLRILGVGSIDAIGQIGRRWSFTSYLQEEPEKAWLIVEVIRDGKLLDQPKRKHESVSSPP